MAESTLTMKHADLVKAVAHKVGWGYTAWADLSGARQNIMTRVLNQMCRIFYYPPPLPGETDAHIWSFMRPVTTLNLYTTVTANTISTVTVDVDETTLVSAMEGATAKFATSGTSYTIDSITDSDTMVLTSSAAAESDTDEIYIFGHTRAFDFPDAFGGFVGRAHMLESSGVFTPLEHISDVRARDLQQRDPARTGRPEFISQRSNASLGTGTRWQGIVYPLPDDDYIITYQYILIPEQLVTSTAEYPYGGAPHAETMIAAAMAAWELVMDEHRGEHWAYYVERLVASVKYDRRQSMPDFFGRNLDSNLDRVGRVTPRMSDASKIYLDGTRIL